MFRGGRSDRGHGRGRGGFDSPRDSVERGGFRGGFDNIPRGGRGGGFGSREDFGGPPLNQEQGNNFGPPSRGGRGFTPRGRGGMPDGPFQRSDFEFSNANEHDPDRAYNEFASQARDGFTPRGRGSRTFENRGRGGISNNARGGFDDSSQGGFENSEFDDNSNGDFDTINQGGFNNSSRGGNNNRGGFGNHSRGGFDNKARGGFENSSRGGFDNNSRGAFNSNGGFDNTSRGGFENNSLGGFNSNPCEGFDNSPRGGFDNTSQGNSNTRGGIENRSRGGLENKSHGGFDKSTRGGFDNSFGGFNNSSPGGFEKSLRGGTGSSSHGGFDNNSHSGFDSSSRGGFDKSLRGGFEGSSRGGFDNSSRGAFDNNSRGGFDNSSHVDLEKGRRGGFNSSSHDVFEKSLKGGFDNNFQDEFENNSQGRPDDGSFGGFDNNSRRGFHSRGGRGRDGFENNRGRGGPPQMNDESRTGFDTNQNSSRGFTPRGGGRGVNPNANESNQRGGFEPGQRGGRGSFGSSPGFGKDSSQNASSALGSQNQIVSSNPMGKDTVKEEPESKFRAPVKEERANRVSRFGPPVADPALLVEEIKVESSLPSSSKIECLPCNAQFTNSISYRLHLMGESHQSRASKFIPSQTIKEEKPFSAAQNFTPNVKQEIQQDKPFSMQKQQEPFPIEQQQDPFCRQQQPMGKQHEPFSRQQQEIGIQQKPQQQQPMGMQKQQQQQQPMGTQKQQQQHQQQQQPPQQPIGKQQESSVRPTQGMTKQDQIAPAQKQFTSPFGQQQQQHQGQGQFSSSFGEKQQMVDTESSQPGEIDDSFVILDQYNSDLELEINSKDFCSAKARSNGGFAYMWAGVRATYGATTGKVCFELSVDGNGDTAHLEDEPTPHVLRVGWSINDASLQLGEEPYSYGFGGTGKCSTRRKFIDYGKKFGVGDVIGCYLDLDSNPIKISYTINGSNCGVAFNIPKAELQGRALFPHIFTKNQHFTLNFGQMPGPLKPLLPGFVPIGQLGVSEGLVRGSKAPATKGECEVLMMIGLPGSGKTYWAENWIKTHPEKKYMLLGTNVYLDRMKVMNLARWKNYHGRWDVLISKCTKCFEEILRIASNQKRNYILDQTNVYPTARGRKIQDFKGFNIKAIVVVPSHEEYLRRSKIRSEEEGKAVPEVAVLRMKANFVLPDIEETFAEVLYTDLPPQAATSLVQQYNREAISKGEPMIGGVKGFIRQNEKKRASLGILVPIGKPINENSTTGSPIANTVKSSGNVAKSGFKSGNPAASSFQSNQPRDNKTPQFRGLPESNASSRGPTNSASSGSRFESPWATANNSGPPQKSLQAGGSQGGQNWSKPFQRRTDSFDSNRFGSGPPAKLRREESQGQMPDRSTGSNWSRFDAGDQNRFGNQNDASVPPIDNGLRDQHFQSGGPASQPVLQRRSMDWPSLPAQQINPAQTQNVNLPAQGRWGGGAPIGSRNWQADSSGPPRHPCEEQDDGGFYQPPVESNFNENSSLKRPYSAEMNQPNSRQFGNDGFWSEPPRPAPVPSQTPEGTTGTPDYNALMQHLQYYQSQMNAAQWRGNN